MELGSAAEAGGGPSPAALSQERPRYVGTRGARAGPCTDTGTVLRSRLELLAGDGNDPCRIGAPAQPSARARASSLCLASSGSGAPQASDSTCPGSRARKPNVRRLARADRNDLRRTALVRARRSKTTGGDSGREGPSPAGAGEADRSVAALRRAGAGTSQKRTAPRTRGAQGRRYSTRSNERAVLRSRGRGRRDRGRPPPPSPPSGARRRGTRS